MQRHNAGKKLFSSDRYFDLFINLNHVVLIILVLVLMLQYDSTKVGLTGGGGEYAPQTGFGWTNGAITILMNRYGDILSPKRSETC